MDFLKVRKLLKQSADDFGTRIVGQKRCYFKKRSREVIENKA
jgi:hypothetical protein